MVADTPKNQMLLPERHPQHDLFVCDVADAVLKDDLASMEHPFYSLSKKPDTNIRRYQNNDKWLEVVPSVKGLATIYDKDILIYCISQLIAKMKLNQPISRRVRLVAKDLLIFINRTTGGKDYEALVDALDRLDGTRIRTNVSTGGETIHEGFGLIDSFEIRRSDRTGRILEMSVVLSEWVFNAIQAQEVLTLHRDYFRLRKPIERRVYEIARKHCGKQDLWRINCELLKKKCGSRATSKEFRRAIRELVKGDYLPDYAISFDDNLVEFRNRGTMHQLVEDTTPYPLLDAETYHDAKVVAPGYDVYWLEQEWRDMWLASGMPKLENPDKAFIGFCKRRAEKRPSL